MSNPPTSFAGLQSYPTTLDPTHVAWLKQAKKSKTAFSATKKIALVNDQE
ncbi:hypothetical protein N9K53_01895 [Candidatus Thioglobus sp.]|nr:hypothetical protein [Candidatus Thioglobus sp.]MDA9060531.1 hypothetical protein [Candidatus Thioglobus sp.]